MAAPILLTGEVALEGLVLVIVIVEDDDLAQAPVHAVVLAQVSQFCSEKIILNEFILS